MTPSDVRSLIYIERELMRPDVSPERREELREARGDIGEAHRTNLDGLLEGDFDEPAKS